MAEQSEELIGTQHITGDVITAPFDKIWKYMIDKVYHPDKYLPVSNVKSEQRGDVVYREMTYRDIVKREDIVCNEDAAEIKFISTEKDEVVFNKYDKTTQRISYWLENKNGEPIYWAVPASIVVKSIATTKESAEKDSS
eukprot:TRINITY_DN3018_c0_g1_i1.p1 TRINITY_DN3018_c0_g1~~TRINITY_DN3018_c0_g1_i1.p1  ORF type:complete len:139 (-),score=24.54 TRINITY_DN3018_c0_g1_i1:13-429(-)